MPDGDFDKDWKPNGRPQSTMAKSFSLALDDLFKIDGSLADLDAKVHEKKKEVSTQTTELEVLEARLKATEERLKKASTTSPNASSGRSSPRSRPLLGDTFTQSPPLQQNISPLGPEFEPKSLTRSPTAGNKGSSRSVSSMLRRDSSFQTPPMPGALPPTPGASEGEYLLEPKGRTNADYFVLVKDGDALPAVPSRNTPSGGGH